MSILTDRIGIPTPANYTALIITRVALAHRSTYAEVMGHSRMRPIITARHAAIAEVAKAFPHWSYPMLGRVFGRDHTTIISALQRSGAWVPRGKGNIYHTNLAKEREKKAAGITQTERANDEFVHQETRTGSEDANDNDQREPLANHHSG